MNIQILLNISRQINLPAQATRGILGIQTNWTLAKIWNLSLDYWSAAFISWHGNFYRGSKDDVLTGVAISAVWQTGTTDDDTKNRKYHSRGRMAITIGLIKLCYQILFSIDLKYIHLFFFMPSTTNQSNDSSAYWHIFWLLLCVEIYTSIRFMSNSRLSVSLIDFTQSQS